MKAKTCIFCKPDTIKKRIIAENKNAIAFLTNIPITQGHTLVIPRRCVSTIEELSTTEMQDLGLMINNVRSLLIASQNAQGFNYAWNEGTIAGQNVKHLHIHIVPRTKGDSGVTKKDIRKYLYRPGDRKQKTEQVLKKIAYSIKNTT